MQRKWRRSISCDLDSPASYHRACWLMTYSFSEAFRSGISPRGCQGFLDHSFPSCFQEHRGASLQPPRALGGHKRSRFGFDEIMLLFRRQFYHRPANGRITQRRENLAANPKVGMTHVCALRRFGECNGYLPETLGGHAATLDCKRLAAKMASLEREGVSKLMAASLFLTKVFRV